MFNIFATAKSGMSAYQEKLDYLANDLVNDSTTGYKSTDVGFKDLLTESLNRKGTPLVDKTATNGTGVRIGTNYANNKQGNLLTTGEKTDLAIDGKGYFAIMKSDGNVVYTRDGNLKVSTDGALTDSNGNKVYIEYENGIAEGSPALESKDISISDNGEITMKIGDEQLRIGKIPVFTAIGDKGFIPIGNSYFTANTDANVTLSDDYSIRQGFLEASNVDPAETFTSVINTQRAFQLSSKGITVADELWGMINNMR